MEVKISIFDILSYLMPGFLHLFSIVFIVDSFVNTDLIVILITPSTPQIVAILIVSYILGHALQPLYKANPIYYFFEDKESKSINTLLEEINNNVAKNQKKFGFSSRAVLGNIIQLNNENLAHTSNRFLAMSTLLRNLSFSFFLLSISVVLRHEYLGLLPALFLAGILLLMTILSLYRAQKFKQWASSSVVEGILALTLNKSSYFTEKRTRIFKENDSGDKKTH